MALSESEILRGVGRGAPASASSSPLARVLAVAVPLLLILLWTAAVRLPFYRFGDGDEYFFSVVAGEWLRGGLPYVATFDVKPPGLFLIYAVVQSVFGASTATFKGMEIAAVALGAWSLWMMLRPFASGRLALWCAVLFPVYMLAFGGFYAINVLVQFPFIIAAFAAVMVATDADAVAARRLRAAFLTGLAIGAAGMIKQTAIFEAVAAFGLIWAYGGRGLRLKMLTLFVVGAALPALVFSAYFLAVGHFRDMFDAVVLLAMQRLSPEVVKAYGPRLAHILTLRGALENVFLRSLPLIFLWGGALFALLRIDRVRSVVPPRLLVIAGAWLVLSFAGAVFGRLICDYYLLALVAPLLILAGAFFCCGLCIEPSRQRKSLWVSLGLAAVTLLYTEHRDMFGDYAQGVDHLLDARAVDAFHRLGMKPDDRLLVLNRGMELYTETGARPPTPCFHATHLMSAFPTPVADPLGAALEANPRFIVLADPSARPIAQLVEHYRRAEDYLAAHYRAAATVTGAWDNLTIYEFAG